MGNYLDIVGVTGSIPVAPTIPPKSVGSRESGVDFPEGVHMPWKSILEDHPEHVRLIGLIAIETGNLELALADLLARMLSIPLRIGRAVYLTPQSSGARLHILKNAARASLKDQCGLGL